ncbi:hypothetical protein HGM15179_010575 [Zosterops borbonicus]|uniref:Reverse transcriptase domain-containing protein n=1 Tax=Zosterops borbonicus TaxID=364589 RepID=A0A8K1GE73_9PASS|nr:hypothetical protein HGM15179_010575 [Zosterops borbonicus]
MQQIWSSLAKLPLQCKLAEYRLFFRSSQHGFTKRKSCLTNLMAFYDSRMLNEGREVDIVYLDFSKAFDIVCHPQKRIECTLGKFADDTKLGQWLIHLKVVLPFIESLDNWAERSLKKFNKMGPQLEYCVQFQFSQLKKNEELQETVQWILGLTGGLEHLSYEERLWELGLLNQEKTERGSHQYM